MAVIDGLLIPPGMVNYVDTEIDDPSACDTEDLICLLIAIIKHHTSLSSSKAFMIIIQLMELYQL